MGNQLKRPVITPRGTFPSAKAAAEAYGVCLTTAIGHARNRLKGWSYAEPHPRDRTTFRTYEPQACGLIVEDQRPSRLMGPRR